MADIGVARRCEQGKALLGKQELRKKGLVSSAVHTTHFLFLVLPSVCSVLSDAEACFFGQHPPSS